MRGIAVKEVSLWSAHYSSVLKVETTRWRLEIGIEKWVFVPIRK